MKKKKAPRKKRPLLVVFLFLALALILVAMMAAGTGLNHGKNLHAMTAQVDMQSYLDEQYALALADKAAGELERARNRFEFIYLKNPNYKDAADQWVEISIILNVTRTPTPVPATVTPTPTQDLRPQDELFDLAQGYLYAQNWDQALETLAAMRKANPGHESVAVDGMIYTALRNRGVNKILNQSELESGLYDFALAEQFAPLDRDAAIYQDWARLYLLGNAFWVAYPEIASGYYGQLAGAAPNLTDGSGMTAYFRYWMSLVHIAEQAVAKEDWCDASTAYAAALHAGSSPQVKEDAAIADEKCLELLATETPTPTSTSTETATYDPTLMTATFTSTPVGPGDTATATEATLATATNTGIPPAASDTPIVVDTPTDTPVVPPPTDTDVPPSNTPETPPATNTPETPAATP